MAFNEESSMAFDIDLSAFCLAIYDVREMDCDQLVIAPLRKGTHFQI
jgi:hypothetical protein